MSEEQQTEAEAEQQPDPVAQLAADRALFDTASKAASDTIIALLPEPLRALVPENVTPAHRLDWATKALKSGVAKTDARPQTGTRDADTSRLPPTARIASGYGKTNGA
jgi:hypothetical protein